MPGRWLADPDRPLSLVPAENRPVSTLDEITLRVAIDQAVESLVDYGEQICQLVLSRVDEAQERKLAEAYLETLRSVRRLRILHAEVVAGI